MKEITWEDRYCIGIDEIDKQHMDFIKLLNRIIIISRSGGNIRLKDRLLLEMLKYAEYHFVSEENLMMLYKYPDIDIQKKEHKILLEAFQHQCSKERSGSTNINDLIKYMLEWFMDHTQDKDRKMAEYIKETSSV